MKEEKNSFITELSERLKDSPYFFVADYNKMNTDDFNSLREELQKNGSRFQVVKNTIARRAASKAGFDDEVQAIFLGQSAIVCGGEDSASVAKLLKDFGKKKKKATVRGGVMDGEFISADNFTAVANLPAKEILLAQLLGVLLAPAQKFVRTLNEPSASLARVLQAKAEKN